MLVGAGSIGSNPILPTIWEDSVSGRTLYYTSLVYRGVAQFGRASGLGPEGRTFESCCPDHLKLGLRAIPFEKTSPFWFDFF